MNILLNPTRLFTIFLIAAFLMSPVEAQAHCDTMNGPVVLDAKKALETGHVEPVLKWVTTEAEVKASFAQAMNVRGVNADMRDMADRYFFETVVRLHRMSEGVGYTGLKPATTVEPAIAAADRALETGSAEQLAELLTGAVRQALEAKEHAGDSVEAGRAYVLFTHLAEGIHDVTSGAVHGQEAAHAENASL